MNKTTLIAACLAPLAGVCSPAHSAPAIEITNGLVRVRLYLPDAKTGFYRGTRFDWAGVICSAEYAGHDYFPQWFQRADAKVRDFIYDGPNIVAGPCTAITGQQKNLSPTAKRWDSMKPRPAERSSRL